jgi:DNA-binding PadR family transcriptional regulator
MSIQNAILGLLSWRPATGYDLKKAMEASSSMYWSGNNNQIYKSLVQLQAEGLVTNEAEHREGAPSRKVYSVTQRGQEALSNWVRSEPEPPECRKAFLVQLAWADRLDTQELDSLLKTYEGELQMRLVIEAERMRRGLESPGRTTRETLLWKLIEENAVMSLSSEIEWTRLARERLASMEPETVLPEALPGARADGLTFRVAEARGENYIEVLEAVTPVAGDMGAMDMISLCWENGVHRLLLHGEVLSESFFDLSTKVAGNVLQKFVNYAVRLALVLPPEKTGTVKFREMVAESRRGTQFRVFAKREDAETWLVG